MYKNPLNNGVVSDYNSLKKQRDNGATVKKYESIKLKTKPNELQKYYQYLTYQQPILDELNYVAERMRSEDIKTKTDDYNFIEDLKIKREKLMKENSTKEKDISKDTLLDISSEIKQDDPTPIINTDVEMEYEIINNKINNELVANARADLGFDDDDEFSNLSGLFDDVSNSNNNKKEDKFELSRKEDKEIERMNKEKEKEAEKAAAKAAKEAEKEAAKTADKAEKEAAKAAKKAAKNKKKKEGRQAKKKNQI